MSSLEVPHQQRSSVKSAKKNPNINNTCILKSKENIFKSKCDKVLKKKLKKYRLRRDGKEDDDIIDVSKILISSLKIKSPNGQGIKINKTGSEEILPKNYLFKMVRKKNDCVKSTTKNMVSILESKEGSKEILTLLPDTEKNESTQMDAFKLLMDSRNKSIGGNSPGKEKVIDENDEIENIKKKELKAKRNLVLQQMAQNKGYNKDLENEDYIDECIKKKLEKRADRLKKMISSNNSKRDNKIKVKDDEIKNKPKLIINIKKSEEKKTVIKTGKLQLFNFLSDDENSHIESQNNSKISQEDEEFLRKLAPSIRKKENMLSYFKKVTKDAIDLDEEINVNNDENSIIKVKFAPRQRKMILDKSKANLVDIIQTEPNLKLNTLSDNKTPTRKRKRDKTIPNNSILKDSEFEQIDGDLSSGRPKRAVKKPVKYSNDFVISSSDEELHIFTSRKKKNLDKRIDNTNSKKETEAKESRNVVKGKIVDVSENKSKFQLQMTNKNLKPKQKICKAESSKPVKLAPIFSTKSKLTPLEQEARQKFLKSGVPDKLKIKHKDSINDVAWNLFFTTVHIQQKENTEIETGYDVSANLEDESIDWIAYEKTIIKDTIIDYDDAQFFDKLLTCPSHNNISKLTIKHKPEQLLNFIKKSYLKFPVYRTFHLLKTKSKAEIKASNVPEFDNSVEIVKDILDICYDYPDKLTWIDKYKPMSSKQIIGNFDSIKELKRWLESWSENQIKNKNNTNGDSDLSDFIFSDSDTDSRDIFKHTNNVLIIYGQSGTGKTSCVYSVAAELAIKVIEVNASSKRTGKIMLQDLQEATQSHKVNRGNKKDGSQSSQTKMTTSKIVKKHGRPKKTYGKQSKCVDIIDTDILSQQSQTSSQESTRTESSLILIDDADIVFDQDDGFCSAVSQLIHYSKRPVILITSSLTCPHLQKYISCGKIITMNALLPRMLGTWLDIMCLADTNTCYPGFGCKILDYFRGDIRKTINFLQFYMISNKNLNEIEDLSQDTETYKANIDDENSSMSWADQDIADDNITKEEVDDKEMKAIVERQLMSLDSNVSDLYNIWWNFPFEFSSISQIDSNTDKLSDLKYISLDDTDRILDSISFIDYLDCNKNYTGLNITSKPWLSVEVPSVIDKENMDCYNIMNEINKDIRNELMIRSVSKLKWKDISKFPPDISVQRKRNKTVSQHNTLSKYLNPSVSLDRRALALDYWSSCRTICRLEKSKTDNNLKRNNRFCHYLKSLNILCKNDYFDDLCESLS